jgi:hypothetical protein
VIHDLAAFLFWRYFLFCDFTSNQPIPVAPSRRVL